MTIQGTSWSTSDYAKVGNYNVPILSNANLTCALTSNNNNATVPISADGQISNKYYIELTPIAGASRGMAYGIIKNTQARTIGDGFSGVNYTGCAMVDNAGSIHVNNSAVGATGAAFANATVECMAVDLTGQLIWFRHGAAGNWNNSGVANPATGAGGLSIAALGGVFMKLIAWECSFSLPNVTVTLNSGGSAFTGTVPSGFTAGWPGQVGAEGFMFNTLF